MQNSENSRYSEILIVSSPKQEFNNNNNNINMSQSKNSNTLNVKQNVWDVQTPVNANKMHSSYRHSSVLTPTNQHNFQNHRKSQFQNNNTIFSSHNLNSSNQNNYNRLSNSYQPNTSPRNSSLNIQFTTNKYALLNKDFNSIGQESKYTDKRTPLQTDQITTWLKSRHKYTSHPKYSGNTEDTRQISMIKNVYETFCEKGHENMLTMQIFCNIFKKAKLPVNFETLQNIFIRVDKDKSGSIDLEEFSEIMTSETVNKIYLQDIPKVKQHLEEKLQKLKQKYKYKEFEMPFIPHNLSNLCLSAAFILNHDMVKEIYDENKNLNDVKDQEQISLHDKFKSIRQLFSLVNLSGKQRMQNSHITTILHNLSEKTKKELGLGSYDENQFKLQQMKKIKLVQKLEKQQKKEQIIKNIKNNQSQYTSIQENPELLKKYAQNTNYNLENIESDNEYMSSSQSSNNSSDKNSQTPQNQKKQKIKINQKKNMLLLDKHEIPLDLFLDPQKVNYNESDNDEELDNQALENKNNCEKEVDMLLNQAIQKGKDLAQEKYSEQSQTMQQSQNNITELNDPNYSKVLQEVYNYKYYNPYKKQDNQSISLNTSPLRNRNKDFQYGKKNIINSTLNLQNQLEDMSNNQSIENSPTKKNIFLNQNKQPKISGHISQDQTMDNNSQFIQSNNQLKQMNLSKSQLLPKIKGKIQNKNDQTIDNITINNNNNISLTSNMVSPIQNRKHNSFKSNFSQSQSSQLLNLKNIPPGLKSGSLETSKFISKDLQNGNSKGKIVQPVVKKYVKQMKKYMKSSVSMALKSIKDPNSDKILQDWFNTEQKQEQDLKFLKQFRKHNHLPNQLQTKKDILQGTTEIVTHFQKYDNFPQQKKQKLKQLEDNEYFPEYNLKKDKYKQQDSTKDYYDQNSINNLSSNINSSSTRHINKEEFKEVDQFIAKSQLFELEIHTPTNIPKTFVSKSPSLPKINKKFSKHI